MLKTTRSLDMTVFETFGKGCKKGDVGIEIEAEGQYNATTAKHPIGNSDYWTIVEEGSLRGGWEFVLKRPIPIASVDETLDDYLKVSKDYKLQASLRTSLHVHVNVWDFLLREIYNILGAFWIVETVLVKANGKEREGNLFCLRSGDAEEFVFLVLTELEGGAYFDGTSHNNKRYSSINIAALKKFGSLEFRFMKGMFTKSEISLWTKELYGFVQAARKLDLGSFLLTMESKSPFQILNTFFSANFSRYLMNEMPRSEVKNLLFEGYCYSYRLLQGLKKSQPPVIADIEHEDLVDPDAPKTTLVGLAKKYKSVPWEALDDEEPADDPWPELPTFEEEYNQN